MDIINIPQTGGYPLINETFRAISSYREQLTKLLASLNLPPQTCVFLDSIVNPNSTAQKYLVYIKNSTGSSYVLTLNMGSYSYNQIFENASVPNLQVIKQEQHIDTENSLGLFINTRTIITGNLQTATTTTKFTFLTLKKALQDNYDIQTILEDFYNNYDINRIIPMQTWNLRDLTFYKYLNLWFNKNNLTINSTSEFLGTYASIGTSLDIKIGGGFLKINVDFSTVNLLNFAIYSTLLIPLPTELFFNKLVKIKIGMLHVISSNNTVKPFSLLDEYGFCGFLYGNYLGFECPRTNITSGTQLFINEVISYP